MSKTGALGKTPRVSLASELENMEEFIENLVKKHPSAVGNYNLMILYSWFYITGNRAFIQFTERDLNLMPSSETITRAWRSLKKKKPELADPDVEALRLDRENQYHEYYSRRLKPY